MKSARLLLLLSPVISALLAGCGGSGSQETASPLRAFQVGNRWVFEGHNFEGDVVSEYTDTVEVVNEELNGTLYPSFRHVMTSDFRPDVVFADIVTQNAQTRDITLVGTLRPDGRKKAFAPNLILPGRMYLGQRWTVHFDEDEGENYVECQVVAQEEVETAIGRFQTWKMHATTHAGVNSGESDLWLSPELGYYVRIVAKSGGVTNTRNLISTNYRLRQQR